MKKYLVAIGVLSVFLLSVLVVQGAEEASWGEIKKQVKEDNSLEPAAKKAAKVDICHYDADEDLFKVINISGNAVDKHIENHGDVFPSTFYADADGDGYGDPNGDTDACPNTGFVDNAADCDDTDASINPGAEEVCGDGIDNNCSGEADEGCVTGCVTIRVDCNPSSWVIQKSCGPGRHYIHDWWWASYVEFDENVNSVTLRQIGGWGGPNPWDIKDVTITSSTSLCDVPNFNDALRSFIIE